MQKIMPFLWYDTEAEEAANFYVSVFPNSRITLVTHYGEEGPGPKGTVMTVAFELNGQPFVALNGGPQFKFSQAVSFVVNGDTQEEIDRYWEKLSDGGKTDQCGWLMDRYGLWWQVDPTAILTMYDDKDPAKRGRVMKAMMQMTKMDIAGLQRAADGR